MPKVGRLGRDMMFRSATVQVNLDFASEADMVKKLRVGLALQPLVTALFANSPFTDGKPNGFLSYRSELWRDTDPHRTGMLPFAFEDGMSFERYVDYALDVPMYLVKRGDRRLTWRASRSATSWNGELPQLPGERPTMSDWSDHLTTCSRRSGSSISWRCAAPTAGRALSLRAARVVGRPDVRPDLPRCGMGPRQALDAMSNAKPCARRSRARHSTRGSDVIRSGTLSREMLAIARHGLERRDHLDGKGASEASYLEPAETIVEANQTPAEWLLERYHGAWGGDIDRLFAEIAY